MICGNWDTSGQTLLRSFLYYVIYVIFNDVSTTKAVIFLYCVEVAAEPTYIKPNQICLTRYHKREERKQFFCTLDDLLISLSCMFSPGTRKTLMFHFQCKLDWHYSVRSTQCSLWWCLFWPPPPPPSMSKFPSLYSLHIQLPMGSGHCGWGAFFVWPCH